MIYFIKPDSEYSIVNYSSKLTGKGYELLIELSDNRWYYLNGKCHRENAPAAIYTNGYQAWFIHYKLHRLNGPARIWENGSKEYWTDHKEYEENEYWVIQKKML